MSGSDTNQSDNSKIDGRATDAVEKETAIPAGAIEDDGGDGSQGDRPPKPTDG